jgi:hypothetical protein
MKNIDIIYQILTEPVVCIRRLPEINVYPYVILIIILSGISIGIGEFMVIDIYTSLPYIKVLLFIYISCLIVFIGILWLIEGAVFHVFAEWLHGHGKASVLLAALGISLCPNMLIVPLALLAQICGKLNIFIYFFLKLFIFFWVVWLQIISIREVHNISTFKAILIFSLPAIVVITILCIICMLIIFLRICG